MDNDLEIGCVDEWRLLVVGRSCSEEEAWMRFGRTVGNCLRAKEERAEEVEEEEEEEEEDEDDVFGPSTSSELERGS